MSPFPINQTTSTSTSTMYSIDTDSSTCFASASAIQHDGGYQLRLTFRSNLNVTYAYSGLSLDTVTEFENAESKGHYFVANLSDHAFEKLTSALTY